MYLKVATVSVFRGSEIANVSLADFLLFEETLALNRLSIV